MEEASALLAKVYGLVGESVTALPGYDDAVPPPVPTANGSIATPLTSMAMFG